MVAQLVGEVKGLGRIYQSANPLHKQICDFQEVGIQHPYLVSFDDAVAIRLAGLSRDFTRTNLLPVEVKGENTILARVQHNPLMAPAMAKVAVEVHKRGEYLLQDRVFYEFLKEMALNENGLEPEDRSAHILEGKVNDGKLDLTSEMADTRFILGERVAEYFDRFHKSKSIPAYDLDSSRCPKDECIVNYSWFNCPVIGSYLGFRNRGLYNVDRAFGVLRSTEGAHATKNLGYSLTKIRDASNKVVVEVLTEKGFSGAIEKVSQSISNGLLKKLRTE